jgi:sulfite exporter TauE/SafE
VEAGIIISALLIGLTTSFHCIGMCGPIAFSLGLNKEQKLVFATKNLTYQLGRVTTYSIIGGILGIVGQGVSFAGYQQPLSVIIGVMMILMLMIPKNIGQTSSGFFTDLLIKLKIALGKLIRQKKYNTLYITGLLNGLLPCGAVYTALTASMVTGSVFGGALYMFVFGLGTIPLMYLAVLFGNTVSQSFRNIVAKIFPVVIIVVACLFILRGLGLGIKYISPIDASLEIDAKECCH